MKDFTCSVTAIQKRVLTIEFRADEIPHRLEMLSIINDNEYSDILEEETLETISVEEVLEIDEHDEELQDSEDDS